MTLGAFDTSRYKWPASFSARWMQSEGYAVNRKLNGFASIAAGHFSDNAVIRQL